MSWDYEGGDKNGDYHIALLNESTSYDFMVNYGIYTSAAVATGASGTTLPWGTASSAKPNTLKLLIGAMWKSGLTVAAGASLAASLY